MTSSHESTEETAPRGMGLRQGLLQIAGVAATNHLLTALLPFLPGYESSSLAGDLQLFEGAEALDLAEALARLAILPGVVEELLFRGALFALLARFSSPRIAILGSALAFGLLHVDPHHILIACLLGLQLGLLRHRYGLGLAVLAHVANNAFLLTIRFLGESGSVSPARLESGPISLLVAAAIAGSACAGLVHRARSSRSEA